MERDWQCSLQGHTGPPHLILLTTSVCGPLRVAVQVGNGNQQQELTRSNGQKEGLYGHLVSVPSLRPTKEEGEEGREDLIELETDRWWLRGLSGHRVWPEQWETCF